MISTRRSRCRPRISLGWSRSRSASPKMSTSMKSCSGPPRRISDLYPVPFASSLSFRQRAGGMSGWQRDYDAFTPKGSHLVSQIRAMNWHHRNIDSFSDQPAEQFIVGTVDNVDVDVRGKPTEFHNLDMHIARRQ